LKFKQRCLRRYQSEREIDVLSEIPSTSIL